MYSVSEFGSMIADEIRTDAYVAAPKRVITHDSIVLDIGTGTGVFAVLACRFGARHVYAIEPAEAIHVALKSRFPSQFRDTNEALGRVGKLTQEYSR